MKKRKLPNIAIIVMDTMRLDTFNEIENEKHSFRNLGAVEIKNCIAPAPWTLPSHASLFTGMYPKDHGAHETKTAKLQDIEKVKLKKRTFVADLNDVGYQTYGISANMIVSPLYGFGEFRHFYDTFIFAPPLMKGSEKLRSQLGKYIKKYGDRKKTLAKMVIKEDPTLMLKEALAIAQNLPNQLPKWLKARIVKGWPKNMGGDNTIRIIKKTKFKSPFFIFVNIMEAHDPYTNKFGGIVYLNNPLIGKKPTIKEVNFWKMYYKIAAERAYNIAIVTARQILKNDSKTTIIITSDHGQAFDENGFSGHGTMLYDSLIKVPMLLINNKTKKITTKNKYSSNTNVKAYIEALVNGKPNVNLLYSEHVYSESFGYPVIIPENVDYGELGRFYDVYRKRKFKD